MRRYISFTALSYLFVAFFVLFGDVAFFKAIADSSSNTATASLEIVRPINMDQKDQMSFGKLKKDNKGGGAVLSPDDNSVHFTGDLSFLSDEGVKSAAFEINGNQGSNYTVIMPDMNQKHELQRQNGNETISVTGFNLGNKKMSYDENSSSFKIGGKAEISDDENLKPGFYSGSFEVMVAME